MSIESASYISGLVTANPPGTDAISQGDNHIRLIKTVLKATLPNGNQAMNGIHTSAGVAPTSTSAGQLWFDTSDNLLKMRNEADDAWLNMAASEGARLIAVTYANPGSSGYQRSETYVDTSQSITHTALSTTSTLYITYNGQASYTCNFDSGSFQAWVLLSDTSGTLIANTTDDILWGFTDDVDHSANPTWDFTHGVTHTWKVASSDRPTPDSGTTYTFDIFGKIREYDDGGATYEQGSMICLEIEE